MHRYLFIAFIGGLGGYAWGLSDGLVLTSSKMAQVQTLGGLPVVGN